MRFLFFLFNFFRIFVVIKINFGKILYPVERKEEEPQEIKDELVYSEDEDEDSGDGELVSRFQRILAKHGQLCKPEFAQKVCY